MADGLTIKELFTTWGFKVDDKALDALDKRFDRLKSSVQAVGVLAVGAAASIFGMARSVANAGEDAKNAAERFGIGVEALQEYQYAAKLAGIDAGGFQVSLRKLTTTLGDARAGSQGAKDQLKGISKILGYDLAKSGKPVEDLLLDIADGFAKTSDATKKASIAQDLFGRDGGRMINVLNQGSEGLRRQREEARALGIVMDKETVAAADAFNDSFDRARFAVIGLRNVIGVGLFPVLTKLFNRFTAYVVANRELIKLRVDKAIEVLTVYLERALFTFERMWYVVDKLVKLFGGWQRVLRFVTTALVAIMGLRFLGFVGALIQVLGKAVMAFQLLGKAGMLAQLQLAAVPILIGAAFIGLLLILEDVAAFFQGRKSITGMIVNNFEGVKAKVGEFAAWIAEKAKSIGVTIGKAIVDGIAALGAADWGEIAKTLMKVLELMFIGNKIVFQIGLAIAEGILAGLVAGMQQNFPTLAKMLGIGAAPGAPTASDAVVQSGPGTFERIGAALLNGGQGESLSGIALEKIGGLLGGAAGVAGDVLSSPALNKANLPNLGGKSFSGPQVNAPITIMVPEGTPPEQVGPYAQKGVKESLDSVIREAGRATKPAVAY